MDAHRKLGCSDLSRMPHFIRGNVHQKQELEDPDTRVWALGLMNRAFGVIQQRIRV